MIADGPRDPLGGSRAARALPVPASATDRCPREVAQRGVCPLARTASAGSRCRMQRAYTRATRPETEKLRGLRATNSAARCRTHRTPPQIWRRIRPIPRRALANLRDSCRVARRWILATRRSPCPSAPPPAPLDQENAFREIVELESGLWSSERSSCQKAWSGPANSRRPPRSCASNSAEVG